MLQYDFSTWSCCRHQLCYLLNQIFESVSDLFNKEISKRKGPLPMELFVCVYLPVLLIKRLRIAVFLSIKFKIKTVALNSFWISYWKNISFFFFFFLILPYLWFNLLWLWWTAHEQIIFLFLKYPALVMSFVLLLSVLYSSCIAIVHRKGIIWMTYRNSLSNVDLIRFYFFSLFWPHVKIVAIYIMNKYFPFYFWLFPNINKITCDPLNCNHWVMITGRTEATGVLEMLVLGNVLLLLV